MDDVFRVDWDASSRPPQTFREECGFAARLIASRADRPIAVMMSGGIDSEIIARTFLENDIPFQALSYEFEDGKSFHDLRWAKEFCRKFAIPHLVLPFDSRNVFSNELEASTSIGRKYLSSDLYPVFEIERLKLAKDFFTIAGNGEPEPFFDPKANQVFLEFSSSDHVVLQWQRDQNISGTHHFFRTTSELYLSFLTDPSIKLWCELAADMNFDRLTWWKFYFYQLHWPDLVRRQKWSGYENLAERYLKFERANYSEFRHANETFKVPLAAFIDQETGRLSC